MMTETPGMNDTTNHVTVQTLRDREEKVRRLAGREAEIAQAKAELVKAFRTPKLKQRLLELAAELTRTRDFPLVPRLELRNVDLLVAWFIDHFPAILTCTSWRQMLNAPFGQQPLPEVAEPNNPEADRARWAIEDGVLNDLFNMEEYLVHWY
jgi:hypothetical protein